MIFNPKNKKKYLVFTSAGDNTNFYNNWLNENRNFNLMVVYYGDIYNKYIDKCDYYLMRKGSKFQNLYYTYTNYKFIFNSYESFFILDDDIIINTNEINRLFNILKKYDLWILSPSYSIRSKISHSITKKLDNSFLRYTNFIEVGVPLFSKYALTKFMKVYDPILIGYGIDYWYIWVLGINKKNKYAICDEISCINPFSKSRSINKLQSLNRRIKEWNKIKEKNNIIQNPKKCHSLLKIDKLINKK
jgi:hypothetical protein